MWFGIVVCPQSGAKVMALLCRLIECVLFIAQCYFFLSLAKKIQEKQRIHYMESVWKFNLVFG